MKIIIPPLHVKLGVTKNLLKSTRPQVIQWLKENLLDGLSYAKLTEGVLNGPDIRKLFDDSRFPEQLNELELNAFNSLVAYCDRFLGNHREDNFRELAENLKKDFKLQSVNMSVKVHYAVDHVDDFQSNCGGFSDEQGERMHQDLMLSEKRFKGHDYVSMLSEYHWNLKRTANESFGRQSGYLKLHF